MPYKHDIVLSLKSLELLTPTHPQFGQGPKKPLKNTFLHLSLAHSRCYVHPKISFLAVALSVSIRTDAQPVQWRKNGSSSPSSPALVGVRHLPQASLLHRFAGATQGASLTLLAACLEKRVPVFLVSAWYCQHWRCHWKFHQLCQNCYLCWSFVCALTQISVTMFHLLQEMEWKNGVSWILIGFLFLEGKAKCHGSLSSTLWQLEGGIGNIEFQSALFWLWMSMLWRIMVAVEALVVLMQGYQSHEQANLVMILVNLLPGANSGILVPSAKCQWWCTWWMSDGSSGCQTWSGADFASFENWHDLYLGICWRQGFVLLAFKHLKCQYL